MRFVSAGQALHEIVWHTLGHWHWYRRVRGCTFTNRIGAVYQCMLVEVCFIFLVYWHFAAILECLGTICPGSCRFGRWAWSDG